MDIDHTEAQPAGDVAAPGAPGFPIVGIGASAGGFPALAALLEHMPPDPGMALVVILHLGSGPSAADKVLQRATSMPVVQVTHTMPILPDKVYVIPPDRSLKMSDGHLVLDELERCTARPVAIDVFLRTLATAHREHAIGVVLSGMGSDGTAGLACIKEMGGVTIAQLPDEAGEGGMPRSAIESGMADFVLAAADIPRKLVELRDIARRIRQRALAGNPPDSGPLFDLGAHPGAALREVLDLLRARTGHDFSQYRRPTLERRLERRLQVRGLPDMVSYCRLLQNDAGEAQALLKDLLIGVTSFFRDREAFEALERKILPALFAQRTPDQPLRAWSGACSTGEEAYTLAMLLAEHADASGDPRKLQVFASDIDEHAIQVARSGRYPSAIADQVPPQLLQRYFTREGGQYKVRKSLRDLVLFTTHNLLHDPAFSRLDLITCRNFLIYLNAGTHRHVLQQFHFALNPGGILMLGSTESVEAADQLFETVDAAQRIYRAREAVRRPAGGADLPAIPAAALRAPARPPVAPANRRGRLFSFAEIHLHKAAELAPPSILLDARADIVHVSEQAARFLRPAGGEPTRELAALVLPELRLPLRAALLQARKEGREVRTGATRYGRDGALGAVDIQVLPFQDQHAEGELMLVQFHEAREAAAPVAAPGDVTLAHQLDEELRQTRRQLQDAVEQAEETANAMRIYTEEMQTTVEELRARADEAERGKEVLESQVLELEAGTRELQERADTAAKAHDDLANLVASSGVATIFLDRAMRIVRFTPRIADFFNVIPADIGRPLQHITNSFDDPRLAADAAQVFDTLQALEREVRGKDGRDYLVRVHPYRTTTHRIDGAVMSFFDISSRRAAEAALRASEERFRLFVTASSDMLYRMSADWSEMLSMQGRAALRDIEDPSHTWIDEFIPPDEQPRVRAAVAQAIAHKSVFELEHRVIHADGSVGWTTSRAVPLLDENGQIVEWFGAATDISARKRDEEARHESEARLTAVFDSLPVAVGVLDSAGRVILCNREMQRYLPTGILPSRDPERQSRWHALDADGNIIQPEHYPGARALRGERVVPGMEMLYTDDDGRQVWTRVSASPVTNAAGAVVGHVAVVTDIDILKRTEAVKDG